MPFAVERRYVEETEAKLRVRFPAAFVARMLRMNGGTVSVAGESWQLFPFWDRSDRKRVARTSNDIARETMNAREMSWFPPGGVAIASNGAGDHLLFLPAADDPGTLAPAVYFWDMHGDGQPVAVLDHPFELWEPDE